MKLWQVTTNDTQVRFNWFETKKEAAAFARECKNNYADGEHHTVEVESVEFDASRKGLVEALNWVITLTCFNEG